MASGDIRRPVSPSQPFRVHTGHAFEGFELVGRPDGSSLLIAICECGAVLDVADARFVRCPLCAASNPACMRCDGSGRIVDHAALEWRAPADGEARPN